VTITRRTYGSGHRYEVDEIALPGVTTILRKAPAENLIKWAGNATAEYAVFNWAELSRLPLPERLARIRGGRYEDTTRGKVRGKAVHGYAEKLVAGADWSDLGEVPEEYRGHVRSYRQFLDRFDPEPIAIELAVANRAVGYCGTADLIAIMLGQVWLLELKTTRSGIGRESALQACAYARAETYATLEGDDAGEEHPLADLGIERCGSVHIRADGADLRPLDTGETTWGYFQRLAWIHHHDDDAGGWVGDVIEPPARAA
jgi:hypothetical protein